jgi:hypothetical protein
MRHLGRSVHMKRIVPFALAAVSLLCAAAPAGAAEQLLDTITVPANSPTVIQGSYALKVGTRYVIEVSGTMESTNTQGGYGARYDALYCINTINTESDQCTAARTDPANRQYRSFDFKLSSGTVEGDWRLADQFLTTSKPSGDQPAVDYDPNHSYTLGFYPPSAGPIKAQTYYAATGGCPGCTNSTTGTFTVKVFGEPPAPAPAPTPAPTAAPAPSPEDPACASAASVVARAAACDDATCLACKKIGVTWILDAPAPNKPTDVGGVTIDPAAREILFDAGITDAASQQLIATMILQAKADKLRDQFLGCLYLGTLAPDPDQQPGDSTAKNPQKLSAMITACAKLIAGEAEREAAASKPIALTSQAGCSVIFYPIYTKKDRRSARRRRQIASAVKRSITGGCASQGPQLSFRLKSKRKGVPLYKLTNRKLSARLVRVAPKGTPTPASARLYVRWRKP